LIPKKSGPELRESCLNHSLPQTGSQAESNTFAEYII